MSSNPISLPHISIWLLRLATMPDVQTRFILDPLFFASWYALSEPLVSWPSPILDIQSNERKKKLSFERAVAILDKVKFASSDALDLEYARNVLEGYAVHSYIALHSTEFFKILKPHTENLDGYETVLEQSPSRFGTTVKHIDELGKALNLSEVDKRLLIFAVLCTVSKAFSRLIHRVLADSFDSATTCWVTLFACKESELLTSLSSTSALRLSGLLNANQHMNELPAISDTLIEKLFRGSDSLQTRLLEPVEDRASSGQFASIAEEDMLLAANVLTNATQNGINLLLYGAEELDKRNVLRELASRSNKRIYRLRDAGKYVKDLGTLTYIAQRILYAQFGSSAVLVVEQPADILVRKPSDFLKMFMGVSVASTNIAPFDDMMLTTNPSACIWTGTSARELSDESVAKFVFHAPLAKAKKNERMAQLNDLVTSLKLSKPTKTALLELEGLSALQLETAQTAAKLSGAVGKKEFEVALLQAVKRSLKALNRDSNQHAKECVTGYSLDFIHSAGKFSPEKILKALSIRPKGSLCLYGLPGTGKTQFVEFLANKLGKRLISRRASELLDKYVGESEKRISKMFSDAVEAEAILFLDEADSFLRERRSAEHSWEVSQVNELLQQMERFDGIFIIATNLFDNLDLAALRRFTFKVEFLPLTAEQRWKMFVNEAELSASLAKTSEDTITAWKDRLIFMQKLTAGDFATIKRQCVLLDEKLTPDEWLVQLALECSLKSNIK